MSLMKRRMFRVPAAGTTWQIANRTYLATNAIGETSIILDADGAPDPRFETQGLDSSGLNVGISEEIVHFPGISHPPIRRAVIIGSDDTETLLEIAGGIALLGNPTDYDGIIDRINSTLETLSPETVAEEAVSFQEYLGLVGELYTLRDALRFCNTSEEKEHVFRSAAFLRGHIHDWEPQVGSVSDVKSTIKSDHLEVHINSREQLETNDPEASMILLSFRGAGENSQGAFTLRSIVEEIEEMLEGMQRNQFNNSLMVREILDSGFSDKYLALNTVRPPCIILIHQIPDRSHMLAMEWDLHPTLGKPVRLTGHHSLDEDAYIETIRRMKRGTREIPANGKGQ
tara:strand:- start:629 stop:1654 length:1026 start_codon:yes stop_codon:yes gene_type:complete